jgi:D-arabinose 1-dehydrogenase-like Zn-dependent alcohol dehydrogenase
VDFSGVVERVGKNITGFKPGDAVFGGRQGALAQYLLIAEQGLVKKPDNIGFEQAVAVNIAAKTALQALRDAGKLQPGQKVLIIGASGGVGTSLCRSPSTWAGKSPVCAAAATPNWCARWAPTTPLTTPSRTTPGVARSTT